MSLSYDSSSSTWIGDVVDVTLRLPLLLSLDLLAPALRGPGPSLDENEDKTSMGSAVGGGGVVVSIISSTTTVVTGFFDTTTSAFFAD